ncbi:MAG: tetratricopeptide repeat protein [Bacteroidales bacterium]|nr:tetratricopeptide repeat protein [Bacteroidales bacterium]
MVKYLVQGCLLSIVCIVPLHAQKLDEAFLHASAAMQQQAYSLAVREILSVPEKERTPAMLFALGECYYHSGQYDEATAVFELPQLRDSPEAQLYVARVYAIGAQPEKAAGYLQKYLSQRDKLSEWELQLDPALEKMERSKEWRILWEKQWYTRTEQKAAEVAALIKRKKYADALVIANEALAGEKTSGKLYALRARAYEGLEQYEPALESYRNAIQLRGTSPEYYTAAASVAVYLKKYAEALDYMQHAVRLAPYRLDAYLQRASVFRLNKQYEEARKDIRFYFTYFPMDNKALYQMGLAETEAGNPLSAIDYLTMLIDRDKTVAAYFTARAAAFIKAGNYRQADEDLSQALDLDPRSSETWLQKGIALYQEDDVEEACHCWQKALTLGSREAASHIYKYCGR